MTLFRFPPKMWLRMAAPSPRSADWIWLDMGAVLVCWLRAPRREEAPPWLEALLVNPWSRRGRAREIRLPNWLPLAPERLDRACTESSVDMAWVRILRRFIKKLLSWWFFVTRAAPLGDLGFSIIAQKRTGG